MVTSQEILGLQSEYRYEVRGMQYSGGDTAAEIEDYEAVQLFIERAQRVNPVFKMSQSDRIFVPLICQEIEGMPLGIEMAAGWVDVISCEEIYGKIKGNLDFLKTSASDVPERQRSLQAVFEYSWNLLPEPTRKSLKSLSIFQGGFSAKAAEEVSGLSLPMLQDLNNRALLYKQSEARYDLLETIRYYSRKKLEDDSEELAATQALHSHYYFNLTNEYRKAEADSPDSFRQNFYKFGSDAEIRGDVENLRVSVEWYQSHEPRDFVSIAIAFCSLLTSVSSWQEVIDWGERACEVAEADAKISPLAKAHLYSYILAWPMWMRGEYSTARKYCERALALTEDLPGLGGQVYRGYALHNLHKTAINQCQSSSAESMERHYFDEMRRLANEFLSLAEKIKRREAALLGIAYGDQGWASIKSGNYKEAQEWFEKRQREPGSGKNDSARQLDLATAYLGQQEYDRAKEIFEQARKDAVSESRNDVVAETLFGLARIESGSGNAFRAKDLYDKAERLWNTMEFKRDPFVAMLDRPIRPSQ